MQLSSTPIGQAWLNRFANPQDKEIASALIDEILLVDRNSLVREIRSLIDPLIEELDAGESIALYAERKVPKKDGEVLPYFSNTQRGRATGVIAPVIDPDDREIGSEGIIANIITDFARRYPQEVLSHPGPDCMRQKHTRHIVIVTDFIGSGKRIWEMLEAFRSVATLQSWRSLHLLSFRVIAYSGTERGVLSVEESRLKPTVSLATGCPTLWNSFSGVALSQAVGLCRRFPPKCREPLGFKNGGALIAFAHGMPNNAPRLLHSTIKQWQPLFPKRSTALAETVLPNTPIENLADRATRLLRIKNAHEYLTNPTSKRWISALVVLATIETGARSAQTISARSGVSLAKTEEVMSYMQVTRWISKRNALTKLGRQELLRLRRRRRSAPILPKPGQSFYYPTQLRAR